jgi:hypothetical protein
VPLESTPTIRRVVIMVVLAGTTTGCAAAASSRHVTSHLECPALQVPAQLARSGGVIMVGELHGTEQAPRFVGDLACALARRGLPVTVALELPVELSDRLQRLATAPAGQTNTVDWQAVFSAAWQDGRRSTAIAELVERVAAMRRAGANVGLASYAPDSAPTAQERDTGMGRAIAALAVAQRSIIVLSGNLHNRLRVGTAISRDYRPAAVTLASLVDPKRIVSLDMAYEAGTAWICTGSAPADCGVRKVGPRNPLAWGDVRLFDSTDVNGYQGRFGVGAVTAALPAAAK